MFFASVGGMAWDFVLLDNIVSRFNDKAARGKKLRSIQAQTIQLIIE